MTITSVSFSLLLLCQTTTSFLLPSAPTAPRTTKSCHHQLFGMLPREESSDTNNDDFDIEAARRQLENLVEDDEKKDDDIATPQSFELALSLSNPPLMSTIGRERREAEIQLLQRLDDGNERVVGGLWTLWYEERGAEPAGRLREAEELMNQGPKQWPAAERMLKDIIQEYGAHWAEPVNKLATLYFLQARFGESRELCELVLTVKPWHFGALSGIVMVCANLRDETGARLWASRRLPSSAPEGTSNDRRLEWVEHAVDAARRALLDEEERIRRAFGKKQRYDRAETPKESSSPDDGEEDAWQ